MITLLEQVEKEILTHNLIPRGAGVVVGVSGGLDSMVLLELLRRLSVPWGWHLVVAHYNHQLRGSDSEADQALVQATCARWQLPCVVGRGAVRERAVAEGISLEMSAREGRHGFFAATAQHLQSGRICLAHQADDQVEHFFLRLLRGAGGMGLGGMQRQSPSPFDSSLLLIRPLLAIPRQALEIFAVSEEIPYREDASNRQWEILRNRVRHDLIPRLERDYQPALTQTVSRAMTIVGEESALITRWGQEWLRLPEPKAPFATLHTALQRRIILLQCLENGWETDFELVERLRLEPGQVVSAPGGNQVLCGADGRVRAWVSGKGAGCGFGPEPGVRINLMENPKGELGLGTSRFSWVVEEIGGINFEPRAQCEYFDADKIGGGMILRHWKPGDRFQPIGMARAQKVQDLFVNLKVPRERRHEKWMGETWSGDLFWVEGVRMGERFKLDKTTKRRLKWCWQHVR